MPRRGGPTVDVLVQSDRWRRQPDAEKTVRGAIAAAADISAANLQRFEVAVVLADDKSIQDLNRIWRGRDAPTNVLSFPAKNAAAGPASALLGDIVIAYETVAQEAVTEQKRFLDHLAHLAVHGFLHLVGYDHETDDEAETMETLERAILRELGRPDPYAAAAPARVINR